MPWTKTFKFEICSFLVYSFVVYTHFINKLYFLFSSFDADFPRFVYEFYYHLRENNSFFGLKTFNHLTKYFICSKTSSLTLLVLNPLTVRNDNFDLFLFINEHIYIYWRNSFRVNGLFNNDHDSKTVMNDSSSKTENIWFSWALLDLLIH